jgi:hypothetical protein
VQSVEDPSVASPKFAGQLIHLNGKADTQERLRDEVFGVEETAIRLHRNVEMFQWTETKKTKKSGSKRKTTYTYDMEWESGREDHSRFEHPNGHENPPAEFSEATQEATKVNLGGYSLNRSLTNSIHSDEHLDWTENVIASLPAEIRDHSLVEGQYLYWSRNGLPSPSSPQLGDQRIAFNVVRPTRVSLVSAAKEAAPEQLKPYTTTNGEELERLYVGDFSAAEVFEKMQGENNSAGQDCWSALLDSRWCLAC